MSISAIFSSLSSPIVPPAGSAACKPRDLDEVRRVCREKRIEREKKNLESPVHIEHRKKRAAELARFDGEFGITLDAALLHTWAKDKTKDPVTAADYWDAIYDERDNPDVDNLMTKLQTESPPIKITLREAFEYVMQKVENFSRKHQILYVKNDELMQELTNIKFESEEASKHFPVTGAGSGDPYVSWFTVICEMLKKTGKIQDYCTDGDIRIVP